MSYFSDNHIANNKHLFGGKAMKKDVYVFDKIAEQFTKASGRLVKQQRRVL